MSKRAKQPWRQARQAVVAVRYLEEPAKEWDITDLRQPQPCEIVVERREKGKITASYARVIAPVTHYRTDGTAEGEAGLQTIEQADWHTIAEELPAWFEDVDQVIMHGEGKVIDAMRQLNALTMAQARLPMARACTDSLARLAGLKSLPTDRWGYTDLESAVTAAAGRCRRLSRAKHEAKVTLQLFDWAHKALDGMSYESDLEDAPETKQVRGPFPLVMPEVARFSFEPYQQPAIEKSLAHAERGLGGLTIAPTGAGKTVMSGVRNASLIYGEPGSRGLVLAESPDILHQLWKAYATLYPTLKVTCCFSSMRDLSGDIVVASRQQLGHMLPELAAQQFSFLDIDEAHHAASGQYRDILQALRQRNRKLMVFGETATPRRGDSKSLRPIFHRVTALIRLQEVRRTGRIVDLIVHGADTLSREDLESITTITESGDLTDQAALSEVLNSEGNNRMIVGLRQSRAPDRLTVVYAVDIAHAEGLVTTFRDADVAAEVVHSRDGRSAAERSALLQDFAAGTFGVLVNVMSLTEGWDCPPASCAIIARPANHPSTLEQMVGRVLRSCEGKDSAMLIEVGVNRTSLSQFLYQFVGEELALEGARFQDQRDGSEGRERAEAEEGESGEGISQLVAWTPPMLPLGEGWFGFGIADRLFAARQITPGRPEWLAISTRAPDSDTPATEDDTALQDAYQGVREAWQTYRQSIRQRPLQLDSAWASQWMATLSNPQRQQAKQAAHRKVVRARIAALRQDPSYKQARGITATRHESINALMEWIGEHWIEPYREPAMRNAVLQELRAPTEASESAFANRYHERLAQGRVALAPRLARVHRMADSLQPPAEIQPSAFVALREAAEDSSLREAMAILAAFMEGRQERYSQSA